MCAPTLLPNRYRGSVYAATRYLAVILLSDFDRTERNPRYPPPINAPAAKTSAPPTTTWKVARRNGVSI